MSAAPGAKNTCPWAEGDANIPQSKMKKETPAATSTCPWGGDDVPVVNAKKAAEPAPWDNLQSGGGFGGQKKSGKANKPTSLWENDNNTGVSSQSREQYADNTTEIARIQADNYAQKLKNAAPKNDGIF
jgi:hypothetical protein